MVESEAVLLTHKCGNRTAQERKGCTNSLASSLVDRVVHFEYRRDSCFMLALCVRRYSNLFSPRKRAAGSHYYPMANFTRHGRSGDVKHSETLLLRRTRQKIWTFRCGGCFSFRDSLNESSIGT